MGSCERSSGGGRGSNPSRSRSRRDREARLRLAVEIEQRRHGLGLEEGGGRGDLEVVVGERWLGRDGSQGGFWREWRRQTWNGGWDMIPRF